MFVRLLMTILTVVFWLIAGALALFFATLALSILPPAGPLIGPFGGLLMLLVIARSAKRVRRHRGAMVLYYLKQAVSLNLPIPPMLAAAQMSEPGTLGRRLHNVRSALENGRSVGEALKVYVPELPERTLDIVAAGERIGRLTPALESVTTEDRALTREESYGPMLGWNYGIVLILLMTLVLAGISVLIMPKFQEIFEDFDVAMPWQTQATFNVLGSVGLPLLPLAVTLIVAVAGWALYQTLHGSTGTARPLRSLTDRLIWLTPLAGTAARDRGLGDACRLMSEALTAGDTLESAAFEAGELKTNIVLKRRLQRFADALRMGRPLRDAAEDARLPKLMVGMLATGQAVSDPIRVFDFLSRFYANRFSRAATLIRASVLPAVVILISIVVGWIVFSMFLPLIVLISDSVVQVGAI
jgi:type II secretory pathway component PulF